MAPLRQLFIIIAKVYYSDPKGKVRALTCLYLAIYILACLCINIIDSWIASGALTALMPNPAL